MVVARQLTRINQRHTRYKVGERCHHIGGIAHTLKLSAVPRVLVVVGREIHTDSIFAQCGVCFLEVLP